MSKHQPIPHPDTEQKKSLEIIFAKAYGKSYRKMRKEDMALMVFNQSSNYKMMEKQAHEVVKIGLAMKRQRDYYLKLIREYKQNLTNKKILYQTLYEVEDCMIKALKRVSKKKNAR